MDKPHNIWMGYDPREDLAYRVARYSILSRTDQGAVNVYKLGLEEACVKSILTRPIERKDGKLWCPISQAPMATEFAISRFCAFFFPWVYNGWTLFMDSDIVCFTDIRDLWKELDDKYAVMCVKHQQKVKEGETKMDGQLQTFYARKNWSSVMAINHKHPANKKFTLPDLNTRPGRDLHAFFWLKDEEIGALDHKWNVLVGVDDMNKQKASGIWHYTLGGPWFQGWKPVPHDNVWKGAEEAMDKDKNYYDSSNH